MAKKVEHEMLKEFICSYRRNNQLTPLSPCLSLSSDYIYHITILSIALFSCYSFYPLSFSSVYTLNCEWIMFIRRYLPTFSNYPSEWVDSFFGQFLLDDLMYMHIQFGIDLLIKITQEKPCRKSVTTSDFWVYHFTIYNLNPKFVLLCARRCSSWTTMLMLPFFCSCGCLELDPHQLLFTTLITAQTTHRTIPT